MARELNISKKKREEILAAAEALDLEGIPLTMSRVRERMGGGSYEAISPVLREYKSRKVPDAELREPPPQIVNDIMGQAKNALWQAACQELNKNNDEFKLAVISKAESLEQQLSEMELELQRKNRECAGLRKISNERDGSEKERLAMDIKIKNQEETISQLSAQLEEANELLRSCEHDKIQMESDLRNLKERFISVSRENGQTRRFNKNLEIKLAKLQTKLNS